MKKLQTMFLTTTILTVGTGAYLLGSAVWSAVAKSFSPEEDSPPIRPVRITPPEKNTAEPENSRIYGLQEYLSETTSEREEAEKNLARLRKELGSNGFESPLATGRELTAFEKAERLSLDRVKAVTQAEEALTQAIEEERQCEKELKEMQTDNTDNKENEAPKVAAEENPAEKSAERELEKTKKALADLQKTLAETQQNLKESREALAAEKERAEKELRQPEKERSRLQLLTERAENARRDLLNLQEAAREQNIRHLSLRQSHSPSKAGARRLRRVIEHDRDADIAKSGRKWSSAVDELLEARRNMAYLNREIREELLHQARAEVEERARYRYSGLFVPSINNSEIIVTQGGNMEIDIGQNKVGAITPEGATSVYKAEKEVYNKEHRRAEKVHDPERVMHNIRITQPGTYTINFGHNRKNGVAIILDDSLYENATIILDVSSLKEQVYKGMPPVVIKGKKGNIRFDLGSIETSDLSIEGNSLLLHNRRELVKWESNELKIAAPTGEKTVATDRQNHNHHLTGSITSLFKGSIMDALDSVPTAQSVTELLLEQKGASPIQGGFVDRINSPGMGNGFSRS